MSGPPEALREALPAVRLLAMDVDGVLTDGTLYYGTRGEELKAFHVRDGLGLRLLWNAGIECAVITARESAPLLRRIQDLRIEHARFGIEDKGAALEQIMTKLGFAREQVAYVGDDLLDLPALERAGIAITVQDGHPLVKERAHWVTSARGGCGAVREIADAILTAQGALEDVLRRLLAEAGAS